MSKPFSSLSKKSPEAVEESLIGRRVLIVDDDSQLLESLSLLVESYNCVPLACSSVAEALSLAEQHPVDLVLMDWKLPGEDGIKGAQELRKRKPQLPIILLSAHVDQALIAEGLLKDLTAVVPKLHLPRLIRKLLSRHLPSASKIHGAQVQDQLDQQLPSWKEQVVMVLNAALYCWTRQVGKSIQDLAFESRLWTATLDGSTYRVRALERYTDLKKLPKRPKLPIVIETARFVLERCPRTPEALDLEARLKMLEHTYAHLDDVTS